MNRAKANDEDYIHVLLSTPKGCNATEAARVQPDATDPSAHDAFVNRLLRRLEPDAATLWREAAPRVERHGGMLGVDESTLNKPYAE